MAAEEKSTEPEPSLVDSLTDLPQQAWRSVVDTLDERTGLPKYPILRYVSDGADAPPPQRRVAREAAECHRARRARCATAPADARRARRRERPLVGHRAPRTARA